jgi:hypothetical protein
VVLGDGSAGGFGGPIEIWWVLGVWVTGCDGLFLCELSVLMVVDWVVVGFVLERSVVQMVGLERVGLEV